LESLIKEIWEINILLWSNSPDDITLN